MPFHLTMPKLSPTMEEGTIALWHKKEGEHIAAGDLIFEVATDKATVEYSALDEGWLRQIIVTEGQSAVVNQPVAILSEEETESLEGFQSEPPAASKQSAEAVVPALAQEKKSASSLSGDKPSEPQDVSQARILASPLAKKLAKERGLDLSHLTGSGPGRRIMSRDLELAKPPLASAKPPVAQGSFAVEVLSPIRKTIAKRLQEAKSTIPHFYVQQTVDVAPLLAFRQHLKELNVVVSINDCIVKACALALQEHPVVNSGFNASENTIVRYHSIDVAVAVSIEEGLITPIVFQADQKPLADLSADIRALAERAKKGKLAPGEFQGGSFTVSNLGMFGVTNFQAIINPPQAAILAVGGILDQPVVKDGAIVAGKVMNLTLSADHRVIDGVAAAKFLNTLKKLIEKPVSLLLAKQQ